MIIAYNNMELKKFLKSHPLIYRIANFVWKIFVFIDEYDLFRRKVKICNLGGTAIIKRSFQGHGNHLYIGKCSVINRAYIRIHGNNNTIKFGNNVSVGSECSFWMEGDNLTITIGDKTTFTGSVHFCVQENNVCIEVGNDCMFSNNIIVRTSDSHPIYDIKSKRRLNPAASIKIGNHVWIAPNSVIMKNAYIENGSIIGSNTLVNKYVPQNSLVVGTPMKIAKENIYWTREALF